MAKYIKNKKIDTSKSNNVNELKGIDKAAWRFISVFYNTGWNLLIVDTHNNSFRQKVTFYCTLKTNPVKKSKPKNNNRDKLTSIERLSPLIPTKTLKEVNEISKFFKTKVTSQANIS